MGWFVRFLDIDWSRDFLCPLCGEKPPCVVCDGTPVGIKKDLMKAPQLSSGESRTGTTHEDRVFVHDSTVRILLLQFSGLAPGTRKWYHKDETHWKYTTDLFKAHLRLWEPVRTFPIICCGTDGMVCKSSGYRLEQRLSLSTVWRETTVCCL